MRAFNKLLPNKLSVAFDTFHRFTLRERLKILLGWNAKVAVQVFIDRRRNKVLQNTKLLLTDKITADDQAQADRTLTHGK